MRVCVFVPTVLCWWVSLPFVGSWPSADRLKEKKQKHVVSSCCTVAVSYGLWEPAGGMWVGGRFGGPDVRTSWSYASPMDLRDVTYPLGRTLVWYTVASHPGSPLLAHCTQLAQCLYSRHVVAYDIALLASQQINRVQCYCLKLSENLVNILMVQIDAESCFVLLWQQCASIKL